MRILTRYIIVLGMFILSLLLYIDRVCISVAQDSIAGELSLDDTAMGAILAAFGFGYALFQVPSGLMADRMGPRKVLTAIVTIWSAFTALTGMAWNYMSLLITRFLFGAGEAGAFPGMSRAIFSWIPLRERGLVLGLNFSGSRLGAAFAMPFVSWLITDFGWRTSFYILGGIGVVWAVMWWFLFRDNPEEHPFIADQEKNDIIAHRQQPEAHSAERLSASELLGSTNMWVAMIQYFCSNFTFYFALTWLFPYLKKTYDLESLEAGWYSMAPFIAGAVGNWAAGLILDRLYNQGRWNQSRKLPAMIGFILAAAGLIGSVFMKTPETAVIMLSIAIFGADMTLPPSWALCVDIGKKNAGTASSTMNMAGNVGSVLTALAFPWLVALTGSVDYFFYIAAGLNLIAVLLWWKTKADKGLAF